MWWLIVSVFRRSWQSLRRGWPTNDRNGSRSGDSSARKNDDRNGWERKKKRNSDGKMRSLNDVIIYLCDSSINSSRSSTLIFCFNWHWCYTTYVGSGVAVRTLYFGLWILEFDSQTSLCATFASWLLANYSYVPQSPSSTAWYWPQGWDVMWFGI